MSTVIGNNVASIPSKSRFELPIAKAAKGSIIPAHRKVAYVGGNLRNKATTIVPQLAAASKTARNHLAPYCPSVRE